MNEPLRINRYLQRYLGISRREADRLVASGIVTIDGDTATHGTIVQPGQSVCIEGEQVEPIKRPFKYIVMNKPAGYICSRKGYRTTFDLLPKELIHLSYIGRLDVNTTGVLLFTDDGHLANRLARSDASRIYIAKLDSPISRAGRELLRKGVMLDGRPVKLGSISFAGTICKLELFEGRWREVRRIFKVLGINVEKLHRKSFAGITVDDVPTGKIRTLSETEIFRLKKIAGLDIQK